MRERLATSPGSAQLPTPGPGAPGTADRLRWLLRLRWLVVPGFVAIDLASDLLLGRAPGAGVERRGPWHALAVGAVLLAANGVYSALLSRKRSQAALLGFARLESALVVSVPVILLLLHGDPADPIRYAVLVGVAGAAVVLPRTGEVAVLGIWAWTSLLVADAFALRLDAARLTAGLAARWATDSGILGSVTLICCYVHRLRVRSESVIGKLLLLCEKGRREWEATFDKLDEMVIVVERHGAVARANRAFARAVGAKPHDLAGRRLDAILAGHPERWWSLQGDGIFEIADPVFDTLFEVTATRLDDQLVLVARDVGELRRLYARLVQADRLAQVGCLASGIAHEINNPAAIVASNLTELGGYVEAYEKLCSQALALASEAGRAAEADALQRDEEIAFARREARNAVSESLVGMERIRQIVANLRALTRKDPTSEPVQPVALAEVIDAVVRTAAEELRAASARVDVCEPLSVMGRRGELVDVVLNLVVNAVRARDELRPNLVTVELRRENRSAVLRVSDTGKGIAPAQVKRLFEPLFAPRAPGRQGSLGLSLARNIVLAHGGSIEVSTQLGTGSTFTVRLPALDAPGAAPPRRESARPQG